MRERFNIKNLIFSMLLVITLAFIWGQSLMPRAASSAESGRVFRMLYGILDPVFGRIITVDEHFVRKLAHFTEYTVLGLELMCLAMPTLPMLQTPQTPPMSSTLQMPPTPTPPMPPMSSTPSQERSYLKVGRILAAAASGLAVAVIDELLQSLSDRSPRLSDVCLDFSGVVFGIVIVIAILKIYNYIKFYQMGES